MRMAFVALLAAAALAAAPLAIAGGGTVSAKGTDFSPKTIKISPGDRVTWVNKGGNHTVTFAGGFNKNLAAGDQVSRKFKKTGTFKYYCIPHRAAGMKGKVVVG